MLSGADPRSFGGFFEKILAGSLAFVHRRDHDVVDLQIWPLDRWAAARLSRLYGSLEPHGKRW